MKQLSVLLIIGLVGCAPTANESTRSLRFEYVKKPSREGFDLLFDRKTGCVAEVRTDSPETLSNEQMQGNEPVWSPVSGIGDWVCPKDIK
jgi:hypothetical protein